VTFLRLARDDGRLAVIDQQRTLTYAQLAAETDVLALQLRDAGLTVGDRITMVVPNVAEALVTILAAARVGVTVVPINLRLRPDDIRFQIDDADVRYAVVHRMVEPLATAAGVLDRPHWMTDEPLPVGVRKADVAATPPPADVTLVQLYTSGTTGRPKGCLLTQTGWEASTASTRAFLGLTDADVVATALPLFHVAGIDLSLSTLAAGGTVVLLGSPDPAAAWSAVTDSDATIVQTISGTNSLLRTAPDDLHRLRGIFAPGGWSPLLDEHSQLALWTGYGATELCGFAVGNTREVLRARPDTVGRPMPGYDSRVVGADGAPVAPGEVGELLMRGPMVTTGYWNLPEASAQALDGGWLHTGDLMELQDDGVLRFVDRLKDMVKPGGENVYCIEVELALAEHPAVREVAVIGVPDKRWGEAVKAVVVTRSAVTAVELDAWCLQRLAAYKRPRWYSFVDALPRNALEKVVKTELRAAHDGASSVRLVERTSATSD
jgi:acyl-CoA synthetase (AMP-forming)/AMP-acid ligase II